MSTQEYPPAWSREWSAPSDWDHAPTGPIPVVRQPSPNGFSTGHKIALVIGFLLITLLAVVAVWAMRASMFWVVFALVLALVVWLKRRGKRRT